MDPALGPEGQAVPSRLRGLAEALSAIASPTRLLLLQRIRAPSTLQEIEVPPASAEAGPRNVARQTVRHHLDRLLDAGVVVAHETERSRGPTVEYVVNHQALFALAEELRGLARLRPESEPSAPTMSDAGGAEPAEPATTGPVLVLVKGLDEGRSFSLSPPASGRREWIVGRKRGAAVSLDFDPFVSGENTLVTWEDGAHSVEDVPGSANGTTLNFRRLGPRERRALRTGDIIGAGRSLLLYRA